MSTQHYSAPSRQPTVDRDGVMTYVDRNGDTIQESSGPHIFRGLALAGGEAFVSDSEEDSEEEYIPHPHHTQHPGAYIPQQTMPMQYARTSSSSPPQYTGAHMMAPAERKSKKEKKSKKSKKERSGSSSSSSSSSAQQHHACSCGQSHH
ncbi:hypothetical protein H072_9883 [Dactylellina haptotyla CBS 200.50]|uniref:Uncharacterized protein n=1 Tax=Dactylellina haptotyla (strain CBS 200.50) TaxID=1284197 RepID=S8A0P8_DACHA|nr:hypothetical protein H072_9883 [Dactylellina haptotyla CBS 200.50]